MKKRKIVNLINVLVVIIAVIALFLAWTAYNRSGIDLEVKLERQIDEMRQETRINIARLEAKTRLFALRAKIATSENYQELSGEAVEIRHDLEKAYEGTIFVLRQDWLETKDAFDVLESNLRVDSAEAVHSLQNALQELEKEIRTEEE
ncbi:MAG: hypothetical protein U9Q85_04160 [Patescibacteria group bacterium]|nr:hypothetical protein [Patescibacteria group bacterium]